MTNRTASHTKTVLAAALAASVLLGLSACGSDKPSAVAANGANSTAGSSAPAVGAPSVNQSIPSDQTTPPAPTTTNTNTTQNKPLATPKPTSTKPTAPETLPTACTPAQLKATVTALSRPTNHVLLTVTNSGKTACSVYYYPALRFDADQQAVTPVIEDSKPQSVVTIAPAASAYAAIGTSSADGSGGAGKLEKQVEVFLEAKDQSGSLSGSLTLPLPANTYVDDKAFVTYWQSDLQDAVAW